jgi:hypothetical protein
MGHGGKRAGAGRKTGALTTRTQELVASAAAQGVTPLEFMLYVLRDTKKPFEDRFKAAVQAAPYVHPRLSSTDMRIDDKRHARDFSTSELESLLARTLSGADSAEESADGGDSLH